jgi:outer membrane protein assembly factor BamD
MTVMSRRWSAVALAVAGLATAGCSRFNPRDYPEPERLFDAAMRQFRAGRFTRAQAAFQALTFNLPSRDTLLTPVRFYIAECQFGNRDFVTAAREFRRLADDFPGHELAPQALLRAGDAYAALWRRAELDPSNGQTALATYQELAGRYPEAPATRIAGVRVRQLQEQFAQKDFQTALFYFRRGAYESSILYLRQLIQQYPSASIVPEAFVRLVRAYRAIGYGEEQQETCAHLRQYYPTRADVRELCGDGNPGR